MKNIVKKWLGGGFFLFFSSNTLIINIAPNFCLLTLQSAPHSYLLATIVEPIRLPLWFEGLAWRLFFVFQICLRTGCASFLTSSVSSSLWRRWASTTMACDYCPPAWPTSRPSPTSTSGNSTPVHCSGSKIHAFLLSSPYLVWNGRSDLERPRPAKAGKERISNTDPCWPFADKECGYTGECSITANIDAEWKKL